MVLTYFVGFFGAVLPQQCCELVQLRCNRASERKTQPGLLVKFNILVQCMWPCEYDSKFISCFIKYFGIFTLGLTAAAASFAAVGVSAAPILGAGAAYALYKGYEYWDGEHSEYMCFSRNNLHPFTCAADVCIQAQS